MNAFSFLTLAFLGHKLLFGINCKVIANDELAQCYTFG
jgi:hypothetical protein